MFTPPCLRWIGLLAVMFAPACDKPAPQSPATSNGTRSPIVATPSEADARPVAIAGASPEAPSPIEPDQPLSSPDRLVAAYVETNEPHARVDIIHALADAGAPGLAALQRIFQLESDRGLKIALLAVAETFDEEHLDGQLGLLRVAMAKEQPKDVRETALGDLLTVTDPRAIPLWRSLLGDADEQTREIAKDQIAALVHGMEPAPDGREVR